MNKMFFVLIAALPFLAGCWPFSSETKKQEATENVMPAAEEMKDEATSSTSETNEEADHSEEAESDEK